MTVETGSRDGQKELKKQTGWGTPKKSAEEQVMVDMTTLLSDLVGHLRDLG